METNGEKWMRADNGIYVPNKKVYVPEYIRIKSPKELQKMDGGQRGEYYSELKWYLNQADISKGNSPDFRKAISLVGEMMRSRNYDLSKIRGLEEVRKQCKGRPVIFVSNHSNSHDFFTVSEICTKNGIPINVMVGTDCLNFFSENVFKAGMAIGLDRNDKESCERALYEAAIRLLNGEYVWIFSEATWNLHPTKLMLPIKIGVMLLALITGALIVPVNLEYVHSDKIWTKEKDLYKEVVVTFGEPIVPNYNMGEIDQNNILFKALWDLRKATHEEFGIIRNVEDPKFRERYELANKLAKYTMTFIYNSQGEEAFIRPDEYGRVSNEHVIGPDGKTLVEGYINKDGGRVYKYERHTSGKVA